ncbi:hypothetical protein ACJIZ3_015470 [Penstemon smallii]|uniref:Uncharacterized protein n=1 Tax=Penstemon smallii TaxID=265156 RepID=A0ABD3RML2_9LAMI
MVGFPRSLYQPQRTGCGWIAFDMLRLKFVFLVLLLPLLERNASNEFDKERKDFQLHDLRLPLQRSRGRKFKAGVVRGPELILEEIYTFTRNSKL